MKKILIVAPHADDEVLGVGGTIAKNIAKGNEVYICVVTHGEEPLFSKEIVKKLREETIQAHQFLGVKKTYFLEYPAVRLEEVERCQLNKSILDVIQEIKPVEVYIPHMGDMQKDHQIVNEAVMVAVRPKYEHKVQAIYAYETLSETEWNIPNTVNAFIPTVYQDISDYLEKKKQALLFFCTQVSQFPDPRSIEAVEALARYRGSTVKVPAAEAFVLVREIKE
ncbi:MAG: PIG-L family deacetylase [Lachnospiraceae bacterium]